MRLTVAGEPWMAHFHHGSDVRDNVRPPHTAIISAALTQQVRKMSDNTPMPIRFTSCVIHQGTCPERPRGQPCTKTVVFTGTAWCSPLDQFERAEGIYRAFKRAVARIPSRAARAELWKQFVKLADIPQKKRKETKAA